jgi:hypothetical protein
VDVVECVEGICAIGMCPALTAARTQLIPF